MSCWNRSIIECENWLPTTNNSQEDYVLEFNKTCLAGRVVVANNVLLSTMWHIASCWVFSKSLIMHVRHLIRNYLWSGKQGGDAYAKVAWEIIKRPKSKGGLDIVDLVDHCQALLVKLIVRGLLPSNQVWKSLLINKLADCSTKTRGEDHQPRNQEIVVENSVESSTMEQLFKGM